MSYKAYPPPPEAGYGYPRERDDPYMRDRRGGDRGPRGDDRGHRGGGGGGGGGDRFDRDRGGGRNDREDRGGGRRERSRERRRSRSRSRSDSPPLRPYQGRRRPTLFDVLPPGIEPGQAPPPILPGAQPNLAAAAAFAAPPPSLAPIIAAAAPQLAPGPMGSGAVSQQATRHARRIYVGGLPPTAQDQSIAEFFSNALAAVGGNTAGPGNAVLNVYINREKNFAFVEFRTVEETSNAMALDGIMFEGVSVRVRRPNDYNPASAASLGPSVPNPNLNLAAIGLSSGQSAQTTQPADASERIFVGGLPYYLSEEQCRELLGSFGTIKSFDLVKDRDTGKSKGYGFVVYMDPHVTDIACAGLNGLPMGDRTLTVRRAQEGAPGSAAASGANLTATLPGGLGVGGLAGLAGLANIPGFSLGGLPPGMTLPGAAMGGLAMPGAGMTRIVVLENAVTPEEVVDIREYEEILADMKDEASRHGVCNNVYIPRPTPENPTPIGMCKVVMEFNDINSAMKARNAMHGRRFAGRVVQATYLPEEAYFARRFDG